MQNLVNDNNILKKKIIDLENERDNLLKIKSKNNYSLKNSDSNTSVDHHKEITLLKEIIEKERYSRQELLNTFDKEYANLKYTYENAYSQEINKINQHYSTSLGDEKKNILKQFQIEYNALKDNYQLLLNENKKIRNDFGQIIQQNDFKTQELESRLKCLNNYINENSQANIYNGTDVKCTKEKLIGFLQSDNRPVYQGPRGGKYVISNTTGLKDYRISNFSPICFN